MNWEFLKNILLKELRVIRGSFKSLIGSYKGLLGTLLIMILGMAGLIVTFYSLFSFYFGDIPQTNKKKLQY